MGKQVDTIYIYTGRALGTILIGTKCCFALQCLCELVTTQGRNEQCSTIGQILM